MIVEHTPASDAQIAAARALLAAHDYVVYDPEQQRQGAEFAAYRIYMSDVRAGKWGRDTGMCSFDEFTDPHATRSKKLVWNDYMRQAKAALGTPEQRADGVVCVGPF